MAEKKEYRNSIRSKRMIREAFIELLNEKDFEKITVTDIVKHADLNRSTFYAHYPDVYGVVEEIEKEILDHSMSIISKLEYRNILKDPLPYLKSISIALEENQELYRLLGRTAYAQQPMEQFKHIIIKDLINCFDIPEEVIHSNITSIRISFFVGGIMHVYQQWIQGELNCTLDEISEDISKLIVNSANDILTLN